MNITFQGWWHSGSPVASGIAAHHILFPLCQRGWTIAAHLIPCVFLRGGFLLDDRWSGVLLFPLWCLDSGLSPQLSVVVFGGFCSNLVCFCHTAMKDSLLVLARCWSWLTGTGAPWERSQLQAEPYNAFIGIANNTKQHWSIRKINETN